MAKITDVSIEGRLANNLLFILCDIIETLSIVSEKEAQKAGFKFDKKTEILLTKIKYAAKDMRKRTTEIDKYQQIVFGEDADKIAKIILTAIDKTGNDDRVMDLFIKYIEAYESRLNLKLNKFGI